MKISKDLPQFSGPPALLLVTARQKAVLYLAHRGQIEEIARIAIPTPRYSDREGHFQRSGRGRILSQGSVYENKINYIRTELIKEVKRKLRQSLKERAPAVIHFFCPAHLQPVLKGALPKNTRELIAFSFSGNYTDKHPFELLRMIRGEIERIGEVRPARSHEAAKLIRKRTRQT